MAITSFQQLSTVVVYVFSQDCDAQALTIEAISELGYPKVQNENGRVQLADPDNLRVVRLQPRRVEFEFAKVDSLAPETIGVSVTKFLEKLGGKKISALGTNYMSKVTLAGVTDAGVFIKNNFLKNEGQLAAALDREIIGSSVRFFAGTAVDYYDIRLSLADLGQPPFIYNLHVHKDITDSLTYKHEDELLTRLKLDQDLLPDLFARVTK